jgi:hypothetical protein
MNIIVKFWIALLVLCAVAVAGARYAAAEECGNLPSRATIEAKIADAQERDPNAVLVYFEGEKLAKFNEIANASENARRATRVYFVHLAGGEVTLIVAVTDSCLIAAGQFQQNAVKRILEKVNGQEA